MPQRAHAEDGFGLIEMVAAMAVLSIALLALLAGYGSGVVSLRAASQKTTATALANTQMELYRALPYASVGLDATTTADLGDSSGSSYDALYAEDDALVGLVDTTTGVQAPSGTVNDVTIANCSSQAPAPACSPIQVVTAQDHHSYRIETFVVDLQVPGSTTGISWTERIVTIVVQNAESSGNPEILRISSGFDRLPA